MKKKILIALLSIVSVLIFMPTTYAIIDGNIGGEPNPENFETMSGGYVSSYVGAKVSVYSETALLKSGIIKNGNFSVDYYTMPNVHKFDQTSYQQTTNPGTTTNSSLPSNYSGVNLQEHLAANNYANLKSLLHSIDADNLSNAKYIVVEPLLYIREATYNEVEYLCYEKASSTSACPTTGTKTTVTYSEAHNGSTSYCGCEVKSYPSGTLFRNAQYTVTYGETYFLSAYEFAKYMPTVSNKFQTLNQARCTTGNCYNKIFRDLTVSYRLQSNYRGNVLETYTGDPTSEANTASCVNNQNGGCAIGWYMYEDVITPPQPTTKTVRVKKSVVGTGGISLPLSGAELEIQDENGNVVNYCTDTTGSQNAPCRWTSTISFYGKEITGVPLGTYYLVETAAPSGYVLSNERVRFVVDTSKDVFDVEIQNTPNQLTVANKDFTNTSQLAGTKLEIQDRNGNVVTFCLSSSIVCNFTTTGELFTEARVPSGTYYLVETDSPDRYIINREKVEFVIDSAHPTFYVEMKNYLNKLIVSNKDVDGQQELPDTTLEIQDINGNVVNYCTDREGNENTECRWQTTDEVYVTEGFPRGTYYLVEVAVPDRYMLNKEKVEFVIDTSKDEFYVEMKNYLNKVIISKKNSIDKKLLPGARLEIQDEEGNVVNYCYDNDLNTYTAECKFESTAKAYMIEGIPNGTYYLVETAAPEGYQLNKEKVKFIVDGQKTQVEVEMLNDLEVEVPNTLSTRSTLLLAIAMFDIALGIGIISYVRKNKVD